jgi:hypothetical protein
VSCARACAHRRRRPAAPWPKAEDHLHESAATGLAAGLTYAEAAEAAISSFGSVRAVVRAHETRRDQAAAALSDVTAPVLLVARHRPRRPDRARRVPPGPPFRPPPWPADAIQRPPAAWKALAQKTASVSSDGQVAHSRTAGYSRASASRSGSRPREPSARAWLWNSFRSKAAPFRWRVSSLACSQICSPSL